MCATIWLHYTARAIFANVNLLPPLTPSMPFSSQFFLRISSFSFNPYPMILEVNLPPVMRSSCESMCFSRGRSNEYHPAWVISDIPMNMQGLKRLIHYFVWPIILEPWSTKGRCLTKLTSYDSVLEELLLVFFVLSRRHTVTVWSNTP